MAGGRFSWGHSLEIKRYDSKMANVRGLLNLDAFEGILRPKETEV